MRSRIRAIGARLRSLALNVLVAVASVAATLFAFEVLAREFAPGWAPPAGDRRFWTFDRALGWHHRPGQQGVHRHRDFEVEVTIGPHGLRDRAYPKERTPGRPRMLVLGDSFGWGHGVARDEIASERIEARHPAWEIINASVSGFGTDQQLLWFNREGVWYAPDVVLLLFHPNDYLDNHRWSRYGYRKPVFDLVGHYPDAHPAGGLALTRVPVRRRSWEDRLDRWLYLHSYLYPRLLELPDLASEFLLALRRPEEVAVPVAMASLAPAPNPRPARRGPELEDEHLEITRRVLHRLAHEVASANAELLVVSVPMATHLRELLGEFLEQVDVPYLPLDAAFATARASPPDERLHFRHDAHWTPAGQRVAADAIETFLVERGLLAEPAAGSPAATR